MNVDGTIAVTGLLAAVNDDNVFEEVGERLNAFTQAVA